MRGPRLAVSLFIVLAVGVTVAAGISGSVPAPVTATLLLTVPGLALALILRPGGPRALADWLALSVGLSITLCILVGLAANRLPAGLGYATWLALLVASVVVVLVAVVSRWLGPASLPRPPALALHPGSVFLMLLALFLSVAAVRLSQAGAQAQARAGSTQLWLLPGPGGGPGFRLGVANMQATEATYRLVVRVDGSPFRAWPAIRLRPGDTWEYAFVPAGTATPTGAVEAMLYLPDSPPDAPYRRAAWRPSVAP